MTFHYLHILINHLKDTIIPLPKMESNKIVDLKMDQEVQMCLLRLKGIRNQTEVQEENLPQTLAANTILLIDLLN